MIVGKRKTLIQINSASTGGLGRLSRDISDVAVKAGWESYIAFSRGKIYNEIRDFKFGSRFGILSHVLLTRLTDRTGCYSTQSTKKLIHFLEEKQPDILQIHNLHGYYINYPLLFQYIKVRKIPVVWTFHDCWPFTGHCVYFTMIKCTQWKYGCEHCHQTRTYPAYFWSHKDVSSNFYQKRECFNGVHNLHIITPSIWLSKLVGESFLSNYPIDVIHNGIDLGVFRVRSDRKVRFRYHIPANKKIVLGVASSWSRRKGLIDFQKMAALLPNEFVVVLAGLSRSQLKHLPCNVIGIEHTETPEDLVALYNEAWVFVNPTYEDNFPTTNLEALACGTSVITYRTGGSPEALQGDKDVGKVIATGNLMAMVQAVIEYRKSFETRQACQIQSKLYDRELAYRKYIQLYEKMIERT